MRRTTIAKTLGCVAVLAVAGPELIGSAVDAALEREVGAALAASGTVAVERVQSRADLGRLDLGGVSVGGRGWRLTIGRLSVETASPPWPSLVSPAVARVPAVTAENVKLAVTGASIGIPRIVARGSDLTPAALVSYLQPDSVDAFKGMLPKLTAASISAAAVFIATEDDVGIARRRLRIANLALTDVSAGHIGSLALSGSAIVDPSGKPADAEKGIGTGAVSISGLDLPLVLDLLTTSRTDVDKLLSPVFDSLSVDGIVMAADGDARMTLGRIGAGALRARRLLIPPDDIVKLLKKGPADQTPTDRQVMSEVVADAAQSAVLDHIEIGGAAIGSPTGATGSFRLGRLAIDGLEPLKLRAMVADDLSAETGGTRVTFDHVVLGGYDASGTLDILKQMLAGGTDPLTYNIATLVPPRTSVTLAGLAIHLPVPPKPGGGMRPLESSETPIEIPIFDIDGGVDQASGILSSHAELQMVGDVKADPSFSAVRPYGIDKLQVSTVYGLSYDPAGQALTVDRIAVDAADLGSVAVSAQFGNVPQDMFSGGADPAAALQASQNALFKSFTCDLANAGLFEKIVPQLAAAAKVSVPLFKAQMKAQAEIGLSQALGPGPATQRLIAAIRTFIDTPKSLSVAVTAPKGLPVATALSAQNPAALMGLLDIKAVAGR